MMTTGSGSAAKIALHRVNRLLEMTTACLDLIAESNIINLKRNQVKLPMSLLF